MSFLKRELGLFVRWIRVPEKFLGHSFRHLVELARRRKGIMGFFIQFGIVSSLIRAGPTFITTKSLTPGGEIPI